MRRFLLAVWLLSAACSPATEAPTPAPPRRALVKPDPQEPEIPGIPVPEAVPPRRLAVEGPIRRGPYVQAVGTSRAVVCFETVERVAGKVACDRKTVADEPRLRHELAIEGLKPATRYSYTIQPGGVNGSFKTSPAGEGDLFFVAWGDSRTYYDRLARIAELAAKDQPDFTVHSGDLVEEGTIEEDWDRFFDAAGPLLRTGALWPSIGNHEVGAQQYFDLFVLPPPENYYTFTAGPAQFFILDGNYSARKDPKQRAWFAEELKKSTARFRFAVLHQPLLSCPDDDFGFDRESSMYGLYGALMEEGKVQVVFQGHNHNYQRAERKGVVYITTGGAGAPLYPVGTLSAETKFAREVHHYVRVRVSGKSWSLEAVDWHGQVIDRAEGTVP